MTQAPVGKIYLQRGQEREEIELPAHNNLYAHAVQAFNNAARGNGAPWATGEDGIQSLAVALAVLESTQSGKAVRVSY